MALFDFILSASRWWHGRRAAWAAVLWLGFGINASAAAGLTVVYDFSAPEFPDSAVTNGDGSGPATPLLLASDGNLYGVTQHGGPDGGGTIFRFDKINGLTTLNYFAAITDDYGIINNNFGPNALAEGTNGYFYGTTQTGGTNRNGTIYRMSPEGALLTLHVFNAAVLDTNSSDTAFGALTNADGANPAGALVLGSDGNFYGATLYGGTNGTGTIFQLTPAGAFTSVYSFSALDFDSDNAEGASPNALVLGGDGSLYGTAQNGGTNGAGAVFAFTPGSGLTALYSFSGLATDPALPKSALIAGPDGNFYGTSAEGGAKGSGTIFMATAGGVVKILFSFPANDDGGDSGAALLPGPDGNFYGTSEGDGAGLDGTIFEITPGGVYSRLYSFSALNASLDNSAGADPFAGLVLSADGYLYGVCSQGGANSTGTIFKFASATINPASYPPAVAKQPPAKMSGLVGSTLNLGVTAQGAPTLVYRWLKNGTNLNNAGEISGAFGATLVISPLLPGDAGSYSVIITNTYGAVTSAVSVLTVLPDRVPPVVTITSPTVNARTNSPVFQGTASDNALLTGVTCWLTNLSTGLVFTNSATPVSGAGGVSNWSVAFASLPGTNILAAQGVDFSGNKSKKVSRGFFTKVPSTLTVNLLGDSAAVTQGTVSVKGDTVPTNNAVLNLGEGYTLAAHTGTNYLFSNWVSAGVVLSNGPTVKFTMQSNLVLTANFVTNFFLAAAGTYNGLFYPASTVAQENSGMLYNLKLGTTGAYTATLKLAGHSYALSGNFNVAGQAGNTVGPATAPGGPWQVALTVSQTSPQIFGTVSNRLWTANLIADQAANPWPSAEYTFLFAPTTNVSAVSPPGDGYALVTNHNGAVTLSVSLADGTAFSQTVPLSQTGDLPVYASLYANTGLLLGWLNLTNLDAAPPTNQLVWIKKPSRATALYTNGFTNLLSTQGSLWTNPPAKTPALLLTNGQLEVTNATLSLNYNVAVSNTNTLEKLTGSPTNSLTAVITPKTGLLTVTFGNGRAKATTTGASAILQAQTNAGGFFLTTTNAGSVLLQP
jgi:uncharacterized repeat protein (TIGR03803 family)